MKARLLVLIFIAALAACGQQSDLSASLPPTRAMGAASAPAAKTSASQAVPGTTVAPASTEDLRAGRALAAEGAPGAAACSSCHGANGEGNAQAGYPRLAGQSRTYIEHQLNSYADGTRANPVMTPIAGALSAQQRAQVAAYFAGLDSPAPSNAAKAKVTSAPVPQLVAQGDDTRHLQACASCHGAQSTGDASAKPYLAGQGEQYLANTLAAWKSGARHNDASGQMPAIAKALSDAETKEIAAYYASLPPPAQAAPHTAQPASASR